MDFAHRHNSRSALPRAISEKVAYRTLVSIDLDNTKKENILSDIHNLVLAAGRQEECLIDYDERRCSATAGQILKMLYNGIKASDTDRSYSKSPIGWAIKTITALEDRYIKRQGIAIASTLSIDLKNNFPEPSKYGIEPTACAGLAS